MIKKHLVAITVLIVALFAGIQYSYSQEYRLAEIGWGGTDSADTRRVPGVAGRWLSSSFQSNIGDRILAIERESAPDCSDSHVVNSFTSAPVFVAVKRRNGQQEYQTWIVNRCGISVDYMVGIWSLPSGESFTRIEPREKMLAMLADEDPLFGVAIKQRDRDRISGDWLDLNLPMPHGWKIAFMSPEADETPAIYEYLPKGQKLKKWKKMLTIQVFAGESRPTPREVTENARQRRGVLCGSEQEEVSIGQDGSPLAPADPSASSAQVLLVCERLPETRNAEVTLAKALAGRKHLYYVHWGWRVRSGDRDEVLGKLETELKEALAMMDQVRLCNPALDTDTCTDPFFL